MAGPGCSPNASRPSPRVIPRSLARPSSASTSSRSSASGASLDRFGYALHSTCPDPVRAALRPRPARDDGRPLGSQGSGLEGARARRPRHRLARYRDRAPADRTTGRPPPWACAGPRRAARHGPHRRDDQPRGGLCRRDGLRHPDRRRPLPLPARHRGPPRRPRAPHPRHASSGCGTLAETNGAAALASDAPSAGEANDDRAAAGRVRAAGDGLGPGAPGCSEAERPWPEDVPKLDEETAIALLPKRPARGHKGSFGKLLVSPARSTTPAPPCSFAAPPAGPASASSRSPSRRRSSRCSPRRSSRRRRWRCPKTTSRSSTRSPRWRGSLITTMTRLVVGPGLRPGSRDRRSRPDLSTRAGRSGRRSCWTRRPFARSPPWTAGGRASDEPRS